jgi:environmental stress-induced protein Ves
MPSFRVIAPSDYRAMPWRNGQGTTTEIAIEPGEGGRFRWRLSIADVVQSGPFSEFPGYERVIAVAEGTGMLLTVSGREREALDADAEPYAFPGDARTHCTLLSGPIRDFNLIYDRALCIGTLATLRFGVARLRREIHRERAFLYALRGDLVVDAGTSGVYAVAAGASLAMADFAGAIVIAGPPGGAAFLAEIAAVPPSA